MIVSPTLGGVIVAIVAFQIATLPVVQSERGGSRFAAEDRKLDRLHPSCLFVCLFCKKTQTGSNRAASWQRGVQTWLISCNQWSNLKLH